MDDIANGTGTASGIDTAATDTLSATTVTPLDPEIPKTLQLVEQRQSVLRAGVAT